MAELENSLWCTHCRIWLPVLRELVSKVFDSMSDSEWRDYAHSSYCALYH